MRPVKAFLLPQTHLLPLIVSACIATLLVQQPERDCGE